MAANQMKLPEGFVLDQPSDMNLPKGFVLDEKAISGELISKLRGSLPIDPNKIPGGYKSPILRHPLNIQRQESYNELLKQGATPEQIKFALDVNKQIETPATLGRTIGGIAGSLAIPAAINLIPGMAALPEEAVTIPMALMKAGKTAAPIIGAGLFGGLGEAAQIALEENRRLSLREFSKAFLIEAGFEAGGRAAVAGGKLALSPFVKRAIPEAAETIEGFMKVGGRYTPTQLDQRFSLSLAEEVSRGSFGARQVFQDLAERNVPATQIYAGQLLDGLVEGGMRLGAKQLGEEFAEGITRPRGRIFQFLDDLFTPLYKQIDELSKEGTYGLRQIKGPAMPLLRGESGRFIKSKEIMRTRLGARLPTKSLKTFAAKEIKNDKRLNGLILSPQGRTQLQKIIGLPDEISFGDMRDLRSSFLKDVRKLARDVSKDETLIKRVAILTDDAMFDPSATKGLTEEASRLLRNVNNLYRNAQIGLKETFSENLAKRLLKNPSAVTKELFPVNNPVAIKNLRQSLIEPISGMKSAEGKRLWEQLRTAKISEWVDDATKGDVVKGNVFSNHVRRMGKEAIDEMLPTSTEKKQLDLVTSLLHTQGKKPLAGASLFIRGGQVGGAIMMYKGTQEGDFLQILAGGTLAMGPYFYAKMAMHPLGQKLLTSGIKLKPGSTSLVPITARLVNLARKIDIEELSKVEKARRKEEWQKGQPKISSDYYRGYGGRGV